MAKDRIEEKDLDEKEGEEESKEEKQSRKNKEKKKKKEKEKERNSDEEDDEENSKERKKRSKKDKHKEKDDVDNKEGSESRRRSTDSGVPDSPDSQGDSGAKSTAEDSLLSPERGGGYVSMMRIGSGGGMSRQSQGSQYSWGRGSGGSRGSSIFTKPDIEIIFVNPLDKKHECPVCCQVLRYPVQFEECGHRCCSSCLPELLRVAPRCPIDQTRVDRDKVYVDKAFQREIDNLPVKCSNKPRGCKWESVLRELMPHIDECNYTVLQCPKGCEIDFERRFLSKHVEDDCPNRDLKCEFCQCMIQYKEEVAHLNSCEKFPIPCPNGCKKKEIPRTEVQHHLDKECSKQDITCPFAEAGCDFKCLRKEMNRHIREEPEKHLEMVSQTLMLYRKTLDVHSKTLEQQADRMIKVEGKVEALEKLYGSQLIWKIDNYAEKLQEAKTGKKTTIYSPPFLTSRHGYKMALSACLYGDGKARGKHLSLFACICRGEYDALLLWPFCHRVTFTLIDQCQDPAARRNVTYTIKPNTCKENKPFLGRPTGDRNASFGAQKFVELEVMNTLDYVRDDTIYIKVNVDNEDMIML